MQPRALVLASLLAMVLLSGSAGAEFAFMGHSPAGVKSALVPQLSCTTVYDDRASSTCLVQGDVTGVQTLRVRVSLATAHLVVRDDAANRQIAVQDCTATCVFHFPVVTSSHVQLLVASSGSMPGAFVHATLESDPFGLP